MLVCWTDEPTRTHQFDERITLALDAQEQVQSPRVLSLHTHVVLLATGSRLRADLHTGGSGARSGHSVIQGHRDASVGNLGSPGGSAPSWSRVSWDASRMEIDFRSPARMPLPFRA